MLKKVLISDSKLSRQIVIYKCPNRIHSRFISDNFFKIVLVGDTGVGKTSVFNRLTINEFNQNHTPTIGVDFKFKDINIGNKKARLQIWDTAGQERYRAICNIYYKGSDIIVLMFDLTNEVN